MSSQINVMLFNKKDAFIVEMAKLWKTFRETKEKMEPLSKVDEALEKANSAAIGTLQAYTPALEELRVYVAAEKTKLADLAAKDENYWVERSGAVVFDSMAMTRAKDYLDQWRDAFSLMKTLAQQLLPVLEAARTFVKIPLVSGIRATLDETSLVDLDSIALEQVVGDLNNSIRSIDIILGKLRNCRTTWLR